MMRSNAVQCLSSAIWSAHQTGRIRHRFGLQIAPALRGMIKKALHPDREKRYQRVADFAEELRNYLTVFSCKDAN